MITAPRAILSATLLVSGATLALTAAPASAQVSDEIVLNIMRQCAKIDDPTARLACYDNNIRSAGANPRSIPGQMAAPKGGGAVANPNTASGFGADDLKTSERFDPGRYGATEISTAVAAVQERQTGIFLVTLGSGAQWLFAETVGRSFRPPKKGETIKIKRGALGSYLMVVDDQQAVRVTRVK